MRSEEAAERLEGIPFMEPALARRVYDHIRETRPDSVLELTTNVTRDRSEPRSR